MIVPWGEMKHIEECCDGIAGSLSDLSFLDESLVEQSSSIFLFGLFVSTVLTVALPLHSSSARDIETHFYELISASACLLPLPTCTSELTVSTCVIGVLGQGHFDGDFIASGKVCVSNFGVRELKCRLVLHAECDFGF